VSSAVRWLAVAAWMAAIFVFSAQPNLRVSDEAGLDFVLRKIGHLVVFGVLAVLLFEALGGPPRRRLVLAFGLTVLYAASDELHQAFVAGRGPAATDVVIDAIGAAAALFVWTRRRKLTSQRRG
jgi:VanZ family protein